ncbi:plasmid replication protein [Azospirillum sp. B21]|uniref:plasmid replication protein n=1 Tax=Azospirillum sp. B21 TaxID=2607496 RepID=UPI0011EBA219|nr:plasmid replication protein [Azospirillum sp. B21]KAA0574385.1 plasmid replication protein [Azospirillum sp. B21]
MSGQIVVRQRRTETQGQTLQGTLFEHIDAATGRRHNVNMVSLYDLAPKYVFDSPESKANGQSAHGLEPKDAAVQDDRLPMIHRQFSFADQIYHLTVVPARIQRRVKGKDGRFVRDADGTHVVEEIDAYPGEREQIIEDVIRKLASDPSRLSVDNGEAILRFSLYEVWQELRSVRHTLSIPEIKEALMVMRRCTIQIERRGRRKVMMDSGIFAGLGLRQRPSEVDDADDASILDDESGDAETFVQFNMMLREAIRRVDWHSISYEALMKIRNPFSRWLFKRIAETLRQDPSQSVVHITARDIIRDSGMSEWSRFRDMRLRIHDVVKALADVQIGALDRIEIEEIKEGRKYVDVEYTLSPSQSFLDQIRRAVAERVVNERELSLVVNNEDLDEAGRPKRFVPVTPETASQSRRRRRAALPSAGDGQMPLLDVVK